jgi:hypothetical protein
MAMREQEFKAHSIDGSASQSTKLARQPNNRVRVRQLRALNAYSVRADRLMFLDRSVDG